MSLEEFQREFQYLIEDEPPHLTLPLPETASHVR
jgi:hypothetical protein